VRARSLESLILSDPNRLQDFEVAVSGLRLNYAFQNVDRETVGLLCALAEQQGLAAWRARMFNAEKINNTENRAVLHTALRRTGASPLPLDGVNVMDDVRATQARIAAFVNSVRTGEWVGATGKKIRAIVNIGIGGSDLGPRMATTALTPFVKGLEPYFVANVDYSELQQILAKVDPETTLFVIVSKTFTTQETLLNARSARQWLVEKLGEAAVARHFVAVSVNRAEVESFGISAANMFPMWDWVGGRYSLWSAVGLSLALAIGNEGFADLLAGAAAMDEHFQTAPLDRNMPVLHALMGVWNRNFLGSPSLAVLPYCERLRDLPRYLQQLEMESNGKSATRDGRRVDYDTVPALFGDCGTVGQHSFHQCLHQGSTIIPADFIVASYDDFARPDHHRALLSNAVAQMGALAFGRKDSPVANEIYEGDRPTSLLALDRLDPFRLGLLLALYEHKTFTQGIIWELNSFDQPGVELGKKMAKGLESPQAAGGQTGAVLQTVFSSLFR
jgi:glucose-6-phosphate isomerase